MFDIHIQLTNYSHVRAHKNKTLDLSNGNRKSLIFIQSIKYLNKSVDKSIFLFLSAFFIHYLN